MITLAICLIISVLAGSAITIYYVEVIHRLRRELVAAEQRAANHKLAREVDKNRFEENDKVRQSQIECLQAAVALAERGRVCAQAANDRNTFALRRIAEIATGNASTNGGQPEK